jgi:hypothetical protein
MYRVVASQNYQYMKGRLDKDIILTNGKLTDL